MPYYISPPPQSPLTRFIAAIIGVFVLAGALILGTVAFVVVAGIGLVAGLAIWLRVAWIKHRLRKSGVDFGTKPGAGPGPKKASGDIIDAEYTVVSVKENQQDQ